MRLLRVLFWSAVFVAFVAAAWPRPLAPAILPGDKVQHVIAFVTLGVLAVLAYRQTPATRLLWRLSAFGALIEIVQTIPALNRDGDVVDWVADTIAAAVAIGVASWWRRRQRSPS